MSSVSLLPTPYSYPSSQQALLGALWADFVPTWRSWQLMFRSMNVSLTQPISYYEVACGESLASPYCRHRDGVQQVRGHRIDVGSESLAYALPWLDPARNYQLLCRFYAPESDTLYQNLFINDSLFASIAIPPSRTETLLLSIPPDCYAGTGSISVKLRSNSEETHKGSGPVVQWSSGLVAGPDSTLGHSVTQSLGHSSRRSSQSAVRSLQPFAMIVLEGITVFESDGQAANEQEGKGGSQGSPNPEPRTLTPALWVSGGNPLTGAVTIRYQMTGPTSSNSVSMTSPAGRSPGS